MFNVGFTELMVVLLVAFLVVGPKDLPKVARWLGRQVKSIRSMLREFKKETGWDDLEGEFRDATREVRDAVKDADVSQELRETEREVQADLNTIREEIDDASDADANA